MNAGGEGSFLVFTHKCVEDRYWIPVRENLGFKGHILIELVPLRPVIIDGGGLTIRKSLSDVICHNAEALA